MRTSRATASPVKTLGRGVPRWWWAGSTGSKYSCSVRCDTVPLVRRDHLAQLQHLSPLHASSSNKNAEETGGCNHLCWRARTKYVIGRIMKHRPSSLFIQHEIINTGDERPPTLLVGTPELFLENTARSCWGCSVLEGSMRRKAGRVSQRDHIKSPASMNRHNVFPVV